MYTKKELIAQLRNMNIDPEGTIIVHSSMKSIGQVKGGGETVIDALIEFMQDGLLVFPTHTWKDINNENNKFYVDSTPSTIGILTELFRKHSDTIRSLHPTHSVAAIGKDAKDFVKGNEKFDTPAARGSSWGKLLDRQAKILLVGVDLTKNTFIHGVEEWANIPNRLTNDHQNLITVLPDGSEIQVPSRRHSPSGISEHYWKIEKILVEKGAIDYAYLGDAKVLVCDSIQLTKHLKTMFEINPCLFSDNEPLSKEFIYKFKELSS